MKALILIYLVFGFMGTAFASSDLTVESNHLIEQVAEESESLQERAPAQVEKIEGISQSCCRICTKGKACGNSCISRRYTCHQPPGCACDG